MAIYQQNKATNAFHDAAIVTQCSLDRQADKAYRLMMNGPVELSSTIPGQEGANYLAWGKAADAARDHRAAHGWLGMTIKQIAASLPEYA